MAKVEQWMRDAAREIGSLVMQYDGALWTVERIEQVIASHAPDSEPWITCSGCGRNGPLSYVGTVRPAPEGAIHPHCMGSKFEK